MICKKIFVSWRCNIEDVVHLHVSSRSDVKFDISCSHIFWYTAWRYIFLSHICLWGYQIVFWFNIADFVFCYIAIISDKNTYHYNSKVLCRVTRVSNSLDKFVWLIGWLGIEKSGQIINHCHNAYQYHDEIRRISLKYMILFSISKYQTIFEWLKRFS